MDFWLLVVIVFGAALVIGFGIVVVRGRADAVAGPPSPPSSSPQTPAWTDRASLDDAVGALLAEGRVIQAIKLIREQTGLGLAQAKEYADRLSAGADAFSAAPAAAPRESISAEAMAHIQQLVARGKKIQAIKELREHTGLGLEEAKDLVDRMADSAAVAAITPDGNGAPAPQPPGQPASDEVMERVRALAAQGRKIHAIKELRDHTKLSLKAAKDVVEGL